MSQTDITPTGAQCSRCVVAAQVQQHLEASARLEKQQGRGVTNLLAALFTDD